MKIAVMAGTPVDTKMGIELLEKNKFNNLISVSISKNPEEQTSFQVSNMEYKENIINEIVDNLKRENCDLLFVYCNSLSGSVNFEKISKEKNIKIITPMDIYKEIAIKYNKIAIISANAQGLSGIERVIFKENENIEIIGLTLLELVKEIEKGTIPEEIIKKFNFETITKYFENMGATDIVLGCTHFPYIKERLMEITKLNIIDPGLKMIEKI